MQHVNFICNKEVESQNKKLQVQRMHVRASDVVMWMYVHPHASVHQKKAKYMSASYRDTVIISWYMQYKIDGNLTRKKNKKLMETLPCT